MAISGQRLGPPCRSSGRFTGMHQLIGDPLPNIRPPRAGAVHQSYASAASGTRAIDLPSYATLPRRPGRAGLSGGYNTKDTGYCLCLVRPIPAIKSTTMTASVSASQSLMSQSRCNAGIDWQTSMRAPRNDKRLPKRASVTSGKAVEAKTASVPNAKICSNLSPQPSIGILGGCGRSAIVRAKTSASQNAARNSWVVEPLDIRGAWPTHVRLSITL